MFIALLFNELFEEALEEIIATGMSWIIGKVLNVLFLVTLTQGTKIILKRLIKSITYKEGNDKMTKFKNFFAKAKKVFTENVIWSNKLTISGWLSVGFMALEGTDVIHVIESLPELLVFGFNVMPYLVYGFLLILSAFGIGKQGLESVKTYLTRLQTKDQKKEVKKEEKEYEKLIEAKKKELMAKQEANYDAQAKALVDAERANRQ